jgi:hypothetical protein
LEAALVVNESSSYELSDGSHSILRQLGEGSLGDRDLVRVALHKLDAIQSVMARLQPPKNIAAEL